MARERSLSPAGGPPFVEFHRPFSYGPDLDLAPHPEPEQRTQRWSAISITSAFHRSRANYDDLTYEDLDIPETAKKEKEDTTLPTIATDQYSPSIYNPHGVVEKTDEELGRPATVRPDLITRNFCILALVFGYLISVACLVIGIRIILDGRIPVPSWLLDKIVSMGRYVGPSLSGLSSSRADFRY